jgi:hypothetical protein
MISSVSVGMPWKGADLRLYSAELARRQSEGLADNMNWTSVVQRA